MTEAEWLACEDPTPMLEFLRGKASNRKLRLFACGCCRKVWHLLPDNRSRDAVALSESYADGGACKEELSAAHAEAEAALSAYRSRNPFALPAERRRLWAAAEAAKSSARSTDRASTLAEEVKQAATYAYNAERSDDGDPLPAKSFQARLIRCIFGIPPFLPSPGVPTRATWNDGTTYDLACAIYRDRLFADLPILADALEDAGCDKAGVLDHLRSPGPHALGCWVLDLLLGKE